MAASARQFLDGLLGPERCKTGWMRAEAAGDPKPWRQQAILGRGRWEADALRDIVRDYALETLADADAVLVIDETGFLKQGKSSCGVGRQYTGSAGKITNCQIGVFTAYASRHGHAFIDRALYLPKSWTDNPARLGAAHVPPGVGFAAKPQLAGCMIKRAIAAGVPFAWVTADSIHGVGGLEMALRRADKGYVLGVSATSQFSSRVGKPEVAGTAEAIARGLDAAAWHRLSAGEGTKGARLHDWARLAEGSVRRSRMEGQDEGYLELADLSADEYNSGSVGLWTGGLLIRRNIADGAQAYFTTWCPAGTSIETLAAVEGRRWAEAVKVPLAMPMEYGRRALRTCSRPPRPNSASTTTRPAPGTAGIATSRWRCWPLPCWRRSAVTPTRRHPQEPCCGRPAGAKRARPHPPVGPADPPHGLCAELGDG